MKTSRLFDSIFLIAVLIILTITITNRVAIQDRLFLRSFHPSDEIIKIANNTAMTDKGRDFWYRGDPQFESRDQLDADCDTRSIGCTTELGKIFVLAPSQTESYPDVLVTSAHEMLHVVYRRLTGKTKANIDSLLELYLIAHPDMKIVVELNAKNGISRLDEAHSRLGTEQVDLGSDLESYYQLYFSDRSIITKNYTKSLRQIAR